MDLGQVCIIAEAGVNHNGSLQLANDLVVAAARAGADIVKFQTEIPENVVSRYADKAVYQKETTDATESQLEMTRRLALPFSDYPALLRTCKEQSIRFLSTPFDLESVDFLLKDCQLDLLKIPSGEITNAPYLLRMAASGCPIILSTGMSNLGEIETALGVLAYGYLYGDCKHNLSAIDFIRAYNSSAGQNILVKKVTLLHCTTAYPASYESINLKAIETLRAAFGLRVGYSDHTPGISVSLAAVAMGACVIEKHFTVDRSLPGPDQLASLEPVELEMLVREIRNIELAMGSGRKMIMANEAENQDVARKSLIAKKAIKKGEYFTEENLTVKRPGNGVSPLRYWEYLQKQAVRDYAEDELI